MYTQPMEKESYSRGLTKIGWQVFMSITAELWQANLIVLVSAFLVIKVTFTEVKYGHL